MNTHTLNKRSDKQPFDPAYDPVVAKTPGQGRDYAPTYWIGTAGPTPEDDGPIHGDVDADVVIVGSGYTGLSAAIHLARDHGIKAVVLEANGVAWGAVPAMEVRLKSLRDGLNARNGLSAGAWTSLKTSQGNCRRFRSLPRTYCRTRD